MSDEVKGYAYPIKCQNCGLHYTVYSWEKWADKHEKGGYCPECGIGGSKVVWGPVEMDQHIFEVVPGSAGMHAITERVQENPFGVMAPKLKEQ